LVVLDVFIDAKRVDLGERGRILAKSASSGLIASHTVCQPTPSRRATEATDALSR
jgi:hypothetical protein